MKKKNWGYLIRYGHTEALLKKMTLNGHFSRPAQTDPYIYGNKTNTNINNLKIDLDHFKGLETNTANTLQRNKKRLLNDTQIAFKRKSSL